MVVLLKNCSRTLRVYNVGDKSVAVQRHEAATTKRGEAGFRTQTLHVSSSVTLAPGELRRVPGTMLKQSAVKRDVASGVLRVVRQEDGDVAADQLTIAAGGAMPLPRGSHPIEEEGSVNIAAFKKSRRAQAG